MLGIRVHASAPRPSDDGAPQRALPLARTDHPGIPARRRCSCARGDGKTVGCKGVDSAVIAGATGGLLSAYRFESRDLKSQKRKPSPDQIAKAIHSAWVKLPGTKGRTF